MNQEHKLISKSLKRKSTVHVRIFYFIRIADKHSQQFEIFQTSSTCGYIRNCIYTVAISFIFIGQKLPHILPRNRKNDQRTKFTGKSDRCIQMHLFVLKLCLMMAIWHALLDIYKWHSSQYAVRVISWQSSLGHCAISDHN